MIRAAKQGEGHILMQIHEKSIRGLCTKEYSPAQLDIWSSGSVEGYEKLIANCPLCLVDEDDGQLTGFVALRRNRSIWQLYVLPEHARKGVGKALLGKAEQYLSSQGDTRAVAEASLTAIGFYKRCGYTVVSQSKVVFGSVELDVVLVEKPLGKV